MTQKSVKMSSRIGNVLTGVDLIDALSFSIFIRGLEDEEEKVRLQAKIKQADMHEQARAWRILTGQEKPRGFVSNMLGRLRNYAQQQKAQR